MYFNNNSSPYLHHEWLENRNNYPNNMVIMDNYYTQDHIPEIWRKIDQLHLSYLELEESPKKLKQRERLEDCISEFLCIASHHQKFCFTETEEVLQRSASSKKDFSGYKAATGWNAIQMYAGNLLSQPWRKEYRQIQTYSGFYKHQVEANLVGAELMFEAMGYKHAGEGVLILEEPVCPDLVISVSKDCLIAYVECQIMKIIWEEVSSSFNISWLDVLEFRKTHLCSPEQSIKALKYKHHQRQYQEHTRSYSQGTEPFVSPKFLPVSVPNAHPLTVHVNHSFPPLAAHNHVPLPQPQSVPQYVYGNGCCANTCTNYAPQAYGYLPYPQPVVKPQFGTNGYYYTNGFIPPVPAGYNYPVPTGQLIELDSHNGYDAVDSGNHSRLRRIKPEVTVPSETYKNKNNNDVKSIPKESEKEDAQLETWDYVYKNLESQGYSKDLGERGDVLSPPGNERPRQSKEIKKVKATNLDEAINNLIVSDRPLKITEALEKVERRPVEIKPLERRNSQGSSYENLAPNDTPKSVKQQPKPSTSSFAKTKTLPREKVQNDTPKSIQSKTLDFRKPKEDKVNKTKEKESTFTWQCKACTYLNETSKDICEICSKTRTTTLDQPMEVGGSECSKCTLVNPKNLKTCQACGASLKNSPTYI